MNQNELNRINQRIADTQHALYDGDTMTAKLNRATAFDQLANQSELIRLEALCRIADALADIAARHE
ncbi:hypothetical protein [Bifidobacterium simiarum]|uniref:hypothetical protein n=1 Tax=Bifidobacterium simiarum TaxID=2045441 RepID=UPI001BDBFF2D|nr:hypothetical protein [Bifidobacterium simiarum]MBT1167013.1 hypothetical protein [Bifidobacterium simiarum]